MIPVTKTYLPNQDKYHSYISSIYESGWLTNNGSLVQELEGRLAEYLGVKHLICVANGSLALQLAYKALELKGEVITTPFSFVATTNTLIWEGLRPVFADIDPSSFNLNPDGIENLITAKTSAIVPTHVYGNPCEVEKIYSIARRNNLKVIYDAAHAFGVRYKNESILNFGDISALSFHATKIFHTIEGGAIVTNDNNLAKKIRLLINFGIAGVNAIDSVGINAKMNEMEAAMGLCNLDEIDTILAQRKKNWKAYTNQLSDSFLFQHWNKASENNCAYVPLLLKSNTELLNIENRLNENKVFPRRYFYPSLDTLDYLQTNQACEISRNIADRILCLPNYHSLKYDEIEKIVKILKDEL